MEGSSDGTAFVGSVVSSTKRKRLASPQMDALETIYHCLGGPEWNRRGKWLESHSYSEWSGVTCKANQITALELSQNNLRGRLDDPLVVDALVTLAPSLEQLWLSENALAGNLPSVLADKKRFPHLTILDVGSNRLRGSLHPLFAKATHFSWFDTSGNELTSYFRYTSNDDKVRQVHLSTSSPLKDVHVVPSLLTKQQCTFLVDLAMGYTKANGGWQMDRHKAYKTTDIDIAVCGGELLDTCNAHLQKRILPFMANLFEISLVDLAAEDLFVAKYSAKKGQQSALCPHRDGSELSFVITLNDSFKGGGTRFIDDDIIVSPETPGTGVFFSGCQLHSGVEVIEGTRYILAGFVRVYTSAPEKVSQSN
jgi:hypothetical protein